MDKQITLIEKSMDKNLTQEQINHFINLREAHYIQAIEFILLHKHILEDQGKAYQKKIFHLKKMIAINKEHNNSKHILQDEIQLKSYHLLQIQNNMVQQIFRALREKSINIFEDKMNEIFVKSQKKITALESQDLSYRAVLLSDSNTPTVEKVKKNVTEYFAIKEINADILRHFSTDQEKIYRLYKYDRYHILKPILYLDHLK
jgi:MscS family membrane protein